jgi:hypothetical protein
MPIDFPNSPTVGQVYTYQGKSWIWNGSGWDVPRALNEIGAVRSFANAADRTAAIPTPTEGIVSYLNDVDRLDIHNGTAHIPAVSTGAWVPYTPTLGNMTQGNGTINAAYSQIGKTINVRFRFVLGSTSSISASGGKSVSLPFAFAPSIFSQFDIVGTGSANFPGSGLVAPLVFTSNTVLLTVVTVGGTYSGLADITNTIPFTWGSGNTLTFTMTYEAA